MAYETTAFALGELAVALAQRHARSPRAGQCATARNSGCILLSVNLGDGHVRLVEGRVHNQFTAVVNVGETSAFVRMVFDVDRAELLGLQVADVDGDRAAALRFARRMTSFLRSEPEQCAAVLH